MPAATSTARAERVLRSVQDRELDALIVTDLVNVRYLTGYTGSNGLAVVGSEQRRFVTDFRYQTQAEQEVDPAFDREIAQVELAAALESGWPGDGPLRVGFDDAHLTVKAFDRLRELLPSRIELVPAGGIVEAARAVKDPEEVERIRAAAQLGDEVLEWIISTPLVGRTEREVAIAMEHRMRVLGAEAPSFESIVASGEHSALPHATPRDVEIAPDTLLTFDWGVVLDGYCSDCTRTFATGGNLPDDLREIYAITLRAQEASLAGVKPGPLGKEVDAIARRIIEDEGHGDHFGHGLGHGVGMAVHEGPRVSRMGETALEAGNVLTVEPGIYVPGRGGVRIEDLVVVTPDGCDVLTSHSKQLVTLS